MESTRIQYGATERIFTTVLHADGSSYTGLTDVVIEILQRSTGKYFDFSDSTFKSSGWVTRQQVMIELDATNSPGVYYYDFDTTGFSAAYTEEDYLVRCSSVTSAGVTTEGELKVGGYVDQIGVFEGGGRGGYQEMSPEQMMRMAKMVWEVILKNKESAEDVLLSRSEFDVTKDKVLLSQDMPDISPVEKSLQSVEKKIDAIPSMHEDVIKKGDEILKEYKNQSSSQISSIETVIMGIKDLMNEIEKNVPIDYSKSFDNIANLIMAINVKELNPIVDGIRSDVQKILSFENDHQKQAEAARVAAENMRQALDVMNKVQEKMNEEPVDSTEEEKNDIPPLPENLQEVPAETLKQ